ncbi:hypothetical protein ACFWYW_59060 [Nonomuraea sp. NPDC059023]|uniref:hypothetical protein n=1 Tax=unclassified Nonomuraea TaxID=2593643 RepID=UPI0036B0A606
MAVTTDLTEMDFDELHKIYLAHPKLCPCPECEEMDERLGRMCISSGCRNLSTGSDWRCDEHSDAASAEALALPEEE